MINESKYGIGVEGIWRRDNDSSGGPDVDGTWGSSGGGAGAEGLGGPVVLVERRSSAQQQRTLALEQNGVGGYGAGSPPSSFTDGTSSMSPGSLCGDVCHSSPVAQPWMHAQASDTATWYSILFFVLC